MNGMPSQGALVAQAKLLLSQAWLDKLVDKLDWATIRFRGGVDLPSIVWLRIEGCVALG